ncbi:MAG: hypothetical protein ACM3P0_17665 [Acidobacteriota bacterium]
MAYKITISTNGQLVNDSDTLQLVIVASVDLDGADQAYSAADKGIKVKNWGSTGLSYDIEELLLTPASLSMVLTDAQGYLDSLFFGNTAEALATNKEAEVQIWLNGALEFQGNINEDSLFSDIGRLEFKFSARTKTDIINKKMVYKDGNPLDPMGPGYSANYVNIQEAIKDVYKLVNPDVVLDFRSNLLMYASRISAPSYSVTDIPFNECSVYAKYLYNYPSGDIQNCGDVLKRLAIDTGSFTGMIHSGRAFFHKLFMYDETNVQELGKVLSYQKSYKYSLIEYVKITMDPAIFTNAVGEAGTFTGMDGKFIDKKSLMGCDGGESVMHWAKTDDPYSGAYRVQQLKDDTVGGGYSKSAQLLANFWYKFRGNMQNCRADIFKVAGITYDFLKNFTYGGRKYQIIEMTKNLAGNTTDITALYLGEL